ncbi:MAG: hypothetical protein ACYC63_04880 [Armatimonadota bacterium]
MAVNGEGETTIGQGTKITFQTVLAMIGLLAVLGGGYLSLQTSVAAHAADKDKHHTTCQLDEIYARNDTVNARLDGIITQNKMQMKQLDRIEMKIDGH